MTRLANRPEAARALTDAMRWAICDALHHAGDCGNRRHGDCLRCRAATRGAQAALDEFARNAVIEERGR